MCVLSISPTGTGLILIRDIINIWCSFRMKKTSGSFITGNITTWIGYPDCSSEQVGYIKILYSIHLPIHFFGEVRMDIWALIYYLHTDIDW